MSDQYRLMQSFAMRQLHAENARLREALKPFASWGDEIELQKRTSASVGVETWNEGPMQRLADACLAAREALKERS